MNKKEYVNKMPFIFDGTPRVPYYIPGAEGHCNRGNLLESMVKFHRGLEYIKNPNTPALKGYDIPEEKIEVKSIGSGLGRDLGDPSFTVSQQIKYYFEHSPKEKRWMYVTYDPKTGIVTEYIMNKSEFGAFLHVILRKKQHLQSNKKSINVRFKSTETKEIMNWLESRCAA